MTILSTMPRYSVALGCCSSGYGYLSGTSMSTPFVSALAGLLVTASPNASAAAIAQRLEQSAASSVAGGAWNQSLGYGVINAFTAVSGASRLTSTGGVVGQIVDSTGAPVTGAQIAISGQIFTTDITGLYRLRPIAAGTYAVTVAAAGYPTQSLSVIVAPGADTPLPVTMGVGYGSFTGTVTNQGAPVAGAIVQALSGGLIAGTAVADLSGNYTLWTAPGAGYTVRASQVGRSPASVSALSVGTGATITVNLTLPSLFGGIAGVVQNVAGNAIPGAQISVSSATFTASTTTNTGGAYSIGRLQPGIYTVTAAASGYATASGSVSVSADATSTLNLSLAVLQIPAPTFTPLEGVYASPVTVTIGSTTPGASIRYTTDGSAPTASTGTLYSGPIAVNVTTTIKAIAYTSATNASSVTSATYTIGSNPWYSAGGTWSYRKPVTIDHTRVAGPLTDFPVLVSLTDLNLQAAARPDGADILFTAAEASPNSITKSNLQRSGQLVAWVRLPALSPAADTLVYLYYGNPAAAPQQNTPAVWDSNYQAVWHCSNTAGLTAADSTANARKGTIMAPSPLSLTALPPAPSISLARPPHTSAPALLAKAFPLSPGSSGSIPIPTPRTSSPACCSPATALAQG